MGNWNITIQGCGQHHNRLDEKDANRMAAKFVQGLKDAGHQVSSATITHGGVDYIDHGNAYLETQDEIDNARPDPRVPPAQQPE